MTLTLPGAPLGLWKVSTEQARLIEVGSGGWKDGQTVGISMEGQRRLFSLDAERQRVGEKALVAQNVTAMWKRIGCMGLLILLIVGCVIWVIF